MYRYNTCVADTCVIHMLKVLHMYYRCGTICHGQTCDDMSTKVSWCLSAVVYTCHQLNTSYTPITGLRLIGKHFKIK